MRPLRASSMARSQLRTRFSTRLLTELLTWGIPLSDRSAATTSLDTMPASSSDTFRSCARFAAALPGSRKLLSPNLKPPAKRALRAAALSLLTRLSCHHSLSLTSSTLALLLSRLSATTFLRRRLTLRSASSGTTFGSYLLMLRQVWVLHGSSYSCSSAFVEAMPMANRLLAKST